MLLETERLLLKSSNCDFAEALLTYCNENASFLQPFEPTRGEGFYTLELQRAILRSEMALQEQRNYYRFYLFLKTDPHKIIGSVGLENIIWGCFLSCFMGYKLSEAYVNKGYMTEAIQQVVTFAFRDLGLHRIEANVMPRNKASLAVLGKCSFVHEGYAYRYLKINGVWEDHVHMVLLNEKNNKG